MKTYIPCTALGLALAAAAPAANAQTVVTRQIVDRPVETVRTVTTTRVTHPATRHRRQVVTTTRQTIVRERTLPTERTIVSSARPVYSRPVYNAVAPAPDVVSPYSRPLYNSVETADPDAIAAPASGFAPSAIDTTTPAYRYVYETDRILVIDPATNIVVQALPR